VGGFEGASLSGAVRARIGAVHTIALDDAEWCRMVAEATAYLLDNPRTLAKAMRDPEAWFRDHWVARERGWAPQGKGQRANGKRTRDGPTPGGGGEAERKAKTERVLDELERERAERTEKRS
jgi:hypothetical protein